MPNRSWLLLLLSFLLLDFTNAFSSPAATRTCCLNAASTSRNSSGTIRTFSQPQQLKSNGLSLEMQPRTAGSVEENEESKKGRWQRLWNKCQSKVSKWMFYQRKNRRTALAAAAVFFSTMISTHRMTSVTPTAASVGSTTASTARVVKQSSLEKQVSVHRGGGSAVASRKQAKENKLEGMIVEGTKKSFRDALNDLFTYMKGPKSDTLILLLATALITPLCQLAGTSPILGFLASGMLLGPNALGWISGIHTTETLAELGIVFFLFEMGIELSFDRLMNMKRDVFGLGMSQFLGTAAVIAMIGSLFGLPGNALVVLGGGLALSSSAFVLQLLKDKKALATRFGKASFGVLLFQDLAVVPLLVVTPILAGGGSGLAQAVGSAIIKAAMAFTSIFFAGRVILNPLFKVVAGAKSQEAFLGVILLTVLSMSFMTEGLGLSNTLGAFLAGVLLSETKYRYQIEADIAPFRGVLLGLFFITVGFEIDLNLIASNLPVVSAIVAGTLALKTAITFLFSSFAFGLSKSTALQTGLILSQGGEFAFVAFGLARNLGILDPATTKLLLTSVALTMAFTPFLAETGSKIAKKLEEDADFTHYLGQDRDASEIADSEDFVVVIGYGTVGRTVCDLLDRKFVKYVGLEVNPNKAIQARNQGLPVFYGDIGRSEVADAFHVGTAKAVIVTISDKAETNRAVISLRRSYPDLKIFARAADADHADRLQRTLDVIAMVPVVPEDNLLLTLPFGGAVLRSLGAEPEEVNAILESKRKDILTGKSDEEQDLILAQLGLKKPLPPTKPSPPTTTTTTTTEEPSTVSTTPAASATTEVKEEVVKKSMVAEVIETISKDSNIAEEDVDVDEEVVEEMEIIDTPVIQVEEETFMKKEEEEEDVKETKDTTNV